MIKKLILLFPCLALVILSGGYIFLQTRPLALPLGKDSTMVTVPLRRGPFEVYEFPSKKPIPLALIIFWSGDGGPRTIGWGSWEDIACRALQDHDYTVIGIDSANYAKTDYDLATLQADIGTIAEMASANYSWWSAPPVIVGGWSMGAAQAIAAAGGPNRPERLAGALIVSPMGRGRYGLRISDRMDVLPTGAGTFAISDFAPSMNGLRIVQWHAGDDTSDSREWLSDLKYPHREYDFPGAGHDYAGPSTVFIQQFVESVGWILNSKSSS